ncbi:response regulator [Paraburkholderia sp. BCC1885]|uniref:response regulator n=1 Tax=Paraburkholderia sp. BCC1885 TaxID=2562669 RepID=UPI001183EDE7|nr:response regulator [Paraburkholderia sp. BCC1885]
MGPGAELQGRRILVVEDDFLVAQGLCGLLEEAGATVVGPLGWADEALKFVHAHLDKFDSAVLDVDLHGEKSYPIADWLATREVRFVFTTGYGADALDSGYLHYPRCEKPFDVRMLFQALTRSA